MNELHDTNHTHDNHIVPQFYLKQWCGENNQINTYDFIHQKYEKHFTSEIGYLKDTYEQDIEDMLAIEEEKIAKIYPIILDKLNNAEYKQSFIHKKSVLTDDEEYTLMKFLYLQKIRTIKGRVMLSNIIFKTPLSVAEALHVAEEQNSILRDKIKNLSKETVYKNIKGCYWFIFRVPRHNCFWTTTNPVHYGEFENLFCPINVLKHNSKNDSMLLSLSPTLKLCITYPNANIREIFNKNRESTIFKYTVSTDFLNIYPLNIEYRWKHELGFKEKIMNAMNLAAIQGYELQSSTCQEGKNGEIHPKAAWFYILSKNFTKDDKDVLKLFSIKDIQKG